MSKDKIELAYITNVMMTLQDAQSVQISCMTRAFFQLLGDDFVFKSPFVNTDFVLRVWRPEACIFNAGIARYLEMTIRTFFWLLWRRPKYVFTRDILLAGMAAVLGFNVTYEFHKECRTFTHEIIYRLLRKRIKVVAISQALGDFLVHAYKTPRQNLLVAHDGVFVEDYDALRKESKADLREELGLPVNQKILLHAGSLYCGRGIGLFETVIKEYPEMYGVSVGGRDADVTRWRSRYSQYDNIHFIPHQGRSTLVKYQMAADILFFPMTKNNPIWWCTSPMKLFEYMATGNIILGSNIGSSGEVINDKNTVVFDPEAPNSLVLRIQDVNDGGADLKMLSESALSDIRTRYTWNIRARKMLDFISSGKIVI